VSCLACLVLFFRLRYPACPPIVDFLSCLVLSCLAANCLVFSFALWSRLGRPGHLQMEVPMSSEARGSPPRQASRETTALNIHFLITSLRVYTYIFTLGSRWRVGANLTTDVLTISGHARTSSGCKLGDFENNYYSITKTIARLLATLMSVFSYVHMRLWWQQYQG
jgi:hypothetical protein